MPLHSEFPINNYSVCQSGLWGFLGFLFYLQDVSVSFLHLSVWSLCVIAHTDCSMNKWNCMFKLLWKPLTGSIFYDLKVFIIQQEAFKVRTYVHTFSFFFDLIFCLLFREGSYSSHTWIIVIFKELETWNYLHLFVFFSTHLFLKLGSKECVLNSFFYCLKTHGNLFCSYCSICIPVLMTGIQISLFLESPKSL